MKLLAINIVFTTALLVHNVSQVKGEVFIYCKGGWKFRAPPGVRQPFTHAIDQIKTWLTQYCQPYTHDWKITWTDDCKTGPSLESICRSFDGQYTIEIHPRCKCPPLYSSIQDGDGSWTYFP